MSFIEFGDGTHPFGEQRPSGNVVLDWRIKVSNDNEYACSLKVFQQCRNVILYWKKGILQNTVFFLEEPDVRFLFEEGL